MEATMSREAEIGIGAILLAYREMGIPLHPNGKCPVPDCPCHSKGSAAIARAEELLRDPDIGDANICSDCHVLIPFLANCYAIDSAGVCMECGAKRGLSDDYKMLG